MFKAITIILLLSCLGVSLGDRPLEAALESDYKTWHDTCAQITGMTDQNIQDVKGGKFADDIVQKRYTWCLWRFSGNMNKEGAIVLDVLGKYVSKSELQPYIDCNKKSFQGGDNIENVWNMAKCQRENLKELFIYF